MLISSRTVRHAESLTTSPGDRFPCGLHQKLSRPFLACMVCRSLSPSSSTTAMCGGMNPFQLSGRLKFSGGWQSRAARSG